MSKKFLLLILVLVGMLCPAWAEEKVAVPNMDMSMVLPNDWFVVPKEQAIQIIPDGSAIIATDGTDDQCLLVVSREPTSARSMEYAILSTVHYVYNKMRGFVDEEEDMELGGEKAFRIRYEGNFSQNGDLPKRYLRVLAIRNGFLYTIQGSARRDFFGKHEGTLREILKTVSWTKKDPEGIKEERL